MKNFKLIIILMIIIQFPVFAHYHWVTVDNYNPEKAEKIEVSVSSGHSFPKPGFLLNKRLIFKTRAINLEKKIDFELIKTGKNWIGNVDMNLKSIVYIEMILKKRYDKEPLYFARAVLFKKKNTSDKITPFSTGNGLEIIPKKNLSLLTKNETVEFQILKNGIPVKTTIRVIREGGGSSFIYSKKDGIMEYKFKKPGKYLFTTNHKRVGASLTFFIPDFK